LALDVPGHLVQTLENLEMKKTLVALAALAATSAFAQSSVVIDGLVDVAYASVSGANAEKYNSQTVTSLAGSATSSINFTATDDIGGGLKGIARVELDPRAVIVDGGNVATHQAYVALAGNMGQIKLGRPNSASLDAFGAASPLGTATGGGYGYTNANVGMTTRFNRSIKLESATYNGFSGSFLFAPGNDTAGTTDVAAYGGLPYQRKTSEIGLKYSNGPLNITFANLKAGAQEQAATVAPTGIDNTQAKTSFNSLGANYTIGDTTLYAGWNKGDTMGSAAAATGVVDVAAQTAGMKTKGTRVGAKYVTGAYTFIVSSAKQEIADQAAATSYTTRKVTGLRAENALSKRTSVYVAYESYNSGKTATTDIGTVKTTAIGLRTSF
jgi:predicted porin